MQRDNLLTEPSEWIKMFGNNLDDDINFLTDEEHLCQVQKEIQNLEKVVDNFEKKFIVIF